MFNVTFPIAAIATLTLIPALGSAENWSLNGDESIISFGSIKNDYIGESHTFSGLSGTVNEDGMAIVNIDLASVQTNVDVRNERMGEFVFGGSPAAALNAQIDFAQMTALHPGEGKVVEVDGTLSFLNEEISILADLYILRVSRDHVLVTTNTPLYLATDELGIDDGLDQLKEIAGLDSIARATPVTMRLMFAAD